MWPTQHFEPERIVQIACSECEDLWKHPHGLSCRRFNAALDGGIVLTDSQYNRLKKRGVWPKGIPRVLRGAAVQLKIEKDTGLHNLFSCQTEADVRMLVNSVARLESSPPSGKASGHCLIIPSLLPDLSVALTEAELRQVKSLAEQLQRRANPREPKYLCRWDTPPLVGAALLAGATAQILERKGVTAYLIRPSSSDIHSYFGGKAKLESDDKPLDSGLQALAQHLGVPNSGAQGLVEKLIETKSVLFIVHPGAIDSRSQGASCLFERVLAFSKGKELPSSTDRCPIVLVGHSQHKDVRRASRQIVPGHPDSTKELKDSEQRSAFFEIQWRRYSQMRGFELSAAAGSSRLKRTREYYNEDDVFGGPGSTASTLRFKAFFASNFSTFSYFDPTAGWSRLAGMPLDELPEDIALQLSDVVYSLRSLSEKQTRNPQLRAVRWCSTGVYWLTSEAVENLASHSELRTTLELFRRAAEEVPMIHVTDSPHSAKAEFRMGMATRAVVQDRWSMVNPGERTLVHFRIARRLFDAQDNKELLSSEYPREPHWGRSRLHFLAECIRHLVRASDPRGETESPFAEGTTPDIGAETFPLPPSRTSLGCNPRQVFNYCFAILFAKELNGDSSPGSFATRKLAHRHGLFHLSAELLQLLSQDFKLGEPHWALRKEYVPRYLREVGYAMLDLGDLRMSIRTFERLYEYGRAHGCNFADLAEYSLDLAMALTSVDLEAAKRWLEEGRLLIAQLQPCQARQAVDLRRRHQGRLAQIHHAEGAYDAALEICESLENERRGALVRDLAHTYIACLGAEGRERPDQLQRAMKVCIRHLFEANSAGLHHEALGFRVALGHLFRTYELLDAAEATLDGVYHDIISNGCSERTYLAMLLEAGRILFFQGRYSRAYAAYLRPCLDRANRNGFLRTATTAEDYALKCLQRLQTDVPREGWDAKQLIEQLKPEGEYLRKRGPAKRLDPLFSFDPIVPERWSERLRTPASIEVEIADIYRMRRDA